MIRQSISMLFLFSLLLTQCKCGREKPSEREIKKETSITIERFDKDLAEHSDNIAYLNHQYGDFFNLFISQILRIGTPDTTILKSRLKDFIHDPDISDIYHSVDKMYEDLSTIDAQLTDAFLNYHQSFPGKIIPRVVTFISGFTYAVVCSDSVLGIGLDMYLGDQSPYYPAINLPQFKIRTMQKSYIAADAMRGWAESEWVQNPADADMISNMLYAGKILYFVNRMLPNIPDTIKTGYTAGQLKWCSENEGKIWSFFIDKQLLFSTDQSKIGKYISEGPTTGGFPKESPGNIGRWMGWRIVDAYMKNHSDVNLEKLMMAEDYKTLFNESGYKPGK